MTNWGKTQNWPPAIVHMEDVERVGAVLLAWEPLADRFAD